MALAKRSLLAYLIIGLLPGGVASATGTGTEENTNTTSESKIAASEIMEVTGLDEVNPNYFVRTDQLFDANCDTMTKILFWRMVMDMSPDSGVVNIGSSRKVIQKFSIDGWNTKTQAQKDFYRDSVKKYHCLPASEHVYLTSGKSHFYDFQKAIPSINRAIPIFEAENTDPWFAQAILLIESPNKLQSSPVGALGSFQLMKGVAIKMGLKVNRSVDEREDFDKSAIGAAKLLRTICIPETNKMLNARGIEYNENDLWYRLLVLHVYHAGAYNVNQALTKMQASEGGMALIETLWETRAAAFGNASQNYSQVALASLLQLNDIIMTNCNDIYFCSTAEEATLYTE